eukprot:tig00001001_g6198.t1
MRARVAQGAIALVTLYSSLADLYEEQGRLDEAEVVFGGKGLAGAGIRLPRESDPTGAQRRSGEAAKVGPLEEALALLEEEQARPAPALPFSAEGAEGGALRAAGRGAEAEALGERYRGSIEREALQQRLQLLQLLMGMARMREGGEEEEEGEEGDGADSRSAAPRSEDGEEEAGTRPRTS